MVKKIVMKDEEDNNEEYKEEDFPLKKSHVILACTIGGAAFSVFLWLNTNFVQASSFKQFKTSLETRLVKNELESRRQYLDSRNDYLEDKIFELSTRKDMRGRLSEEDAVVLDRYKREIQKNSNDGSNLIVQINKLNSRLANGE
jgi:hypothetical protein